MSDKEQLVVVLIQATTVSKTADALVKRIIESDGGLTTNACRQTITDMRERLQRALSAATALEQMAIGVPPPVSG